MVWIFHVPIRIFWPKQAVHSPAFLMQALNMVADIAKCLAAWHTLVKAEIFEASQQNSFSLRWSALRLTQKSILFRAPNDGRW